MVALVLATLLTADPPIHFGGGLGFGVGAPFQTANAGFQLSVKGFAEYQAHPKVGVGLVVPVGFGFFNRTVLGTTVSYTTIDVMPGLRGSFAVLDWVFAALELGLGPSILEAKVAFGSGALSTSRTDFGMRGALLVEVAPPALHGLGFFVEPVALQGRLASASFSEYRFSIGVGYRR